MHPKLGCLIRHETVVNFLVSLEYVDPGDRSRTSPHNINHVTVVTIISLGNAPTPTSWALFGKDVPEGLLWRSIPCHYESLSTVSASHNIICASAKPHFSSSSSVPPDPCLVPESLRAAGRATDSASEHGRKFARRANKHVAIYHCLQLVVSR